MSDTNSMGGIEPPLRSIIREYEMSREGYANLAELFRNRAYIRSDDNYGSEFAKGIASGRPTTVRMCLPLNLPEEERNECLCRPWLEWFENYPIQTVLSVAPPHPLAPQIEVSRFRPYERWLYRRICDYIGDRTDRVFLFADGCAASGAEEYSPRSRELYRLGHGTGFTFLGKSHIIRILNICLEEGLGMSWGYLARLPNGVELNEYLATHDELAPSDIDELYSLTDAIVVPVSHDNNYAIAWLCPSESSIVPLASHSEGGGMSDEVELMPLTGEALSSAWSRLVEIARDYYGSWNWRILDVCPDCKYKYALFPAELPYLSEDMSKTIQKDLFYVWGGRIKRRADTPFTDDEIASENLAEHWRDISDRHLSGVAAKYLGMNASRVLLLNTHLTLDELHILSPPESLNIVTMDRIYLRFTQENVDTILPWLFRNRIGTILYLFDLTRSGYAPSDLDGLPEDKWNMLYTCFDAVFFAIWENSGYAWFSRTNETQIETAGNMA